VSYGDALLYAQRNMDATMKEKYDGHFPEDYDGVQ
jgi:hypothetical protein